MIVSERKDTWCQTPPPPHTANGGTAGVCIWVDWRMGAHRPPEHLGLEGSLHLLSGLFPEWHALDFLLRATSDFPENAAARKSTAQDATLAISALITMN